MSSAESLTTEWALCGGSSRRRAVLERVAASVLASTDGKERPSIRIDVAICSWATTRSRSRVAGEMARRWVLLRILATVTYSTCASFTVFGTRWNHGMRRMSRNRIPQRVSALETP